MRFIRIASLLLLAAVAGASASAAQIAVAITVAPPVLPVYVQPAIPGPGYIWTPGYWAYGDDGYYWVPGTWVRPPVVGVLWTPGYWGWSNGIYAWNAGYWGPRIGYYGGINYGYGYVGVGYAGGYWNGGVFSYNRTVNNFGGVTINNTYNKTIINNNVTQVSYNGGTGGTTAQPTAHELAAANDTHTPPTALQTQHQTAASSNKALLASVNHGAPAVAATSKPGQFTGQGVVAAKAATGNSPAGGNAAGAAAKGTTGTANTLSAKQATGTPNGARSMSSNTGGVPGPKATNMAAPKTGNIAAPRTANVAAARVARTPAKPAPHPGKNSAH
jgi:WXXGXW repeat (2 copies)